MKKATPLFLVVFLLFLTTFVFFGCESQKTESTDIFTPEFVYSYYLGVCGIPRSGEDYPKAINEYIVKAAENTGLQPIWDDAGNVIVEIPASAGMENLPVTILQTRTDANIDISPAIRFDPTSQGVDIYLDTFGNISATQMSMGADSAVGIASLIALMHLEDPHGPMRLLFTAYGSSTMSGAAGLDKKYLEGDLLINVNEISQDKIRIGSKYAKLLTTSSALESAAVKNRSAYVVAVSGAYAHSGDGELQPTNPVAILSEILSTTKASGIFYELSSFTTEGNSLQAPNQAVAVVILNDYEQTRFRQIFNSVAREYSKSNDNSTHVFDIRMIETILPEKCISNADLNRLIACLFSLTSIDFSLQNDVLPTLTVSHFSINPESFSCSFFIEADSEEALDAALLEQVAIEKLSNIHFESKSSIPGAMPPKENETIELLAQALNENSGQEISVMPATNIGELGYFYTTNPNLQVVSIGMQIDNADHIYESIKEKNLPIAANTIASYFKNLTRSLASSS
ncbi:MAG: hypothetical protein LBU41_00170 [Clostridiales Family XIII bacterium]|nr:hypothetical protein [Clostridiales Family XIII bacterium]